MRPSFAARSPLLALVALLGWTLSTAAQTSPERRLQFPPDRPCGMILVQDDNQPRQSSVFASEAIGNQWRVLGPARGDLTAPAGLKVRLSVEGPTARDLSALRRLAPNDLDELELWGAEVNDRSLSWVTHLRGLKAVRMVLTRVGDQGLRQLTNLTSLESLSLPAGTTDAGLAAVARNFPGLKALSFADTRVSNAGLRALASLHALESLEVGGPFIGDDGLAHLAGLTNLEYLLIKGPHFTGRGFVHLKKVPALRVLNCFRLPTMQDAALEHLAALPRLENLSLYDNEQISNLGMAFLARSASLRRLDIDKTRVTQAGVTALLRLPGWEHLSLPSGSVNDTILSQLGRQTHLRYLALGRPRPGEPYTERGLAALTLLTQLAELHLEGPGVTDAAMLQVARFKTLRRLRLMSCPVTDAGLARIKSLSGLETLDLKATKHVTLAGLRHLNGLARLNDLHASLITGTGGPLDLSQLAALRRLTLHLERGSLRDDSLASLQNLHGLEYVQLPSTAISDQALASLSGLTNLTCLVLGGPELTDRGLASLTRLPRLDHLELTGHFSDAGLASLGRLQALRHLHLHSSPTLSPEAVRRLQRAVPTLLRVTLTP